ncbi:hypothetical protein EJB05_14793, partial [Eragrostis curvula]
DGSESDAWGEPTSTPHQGLFYSENARAAHVGNALYFVLDDDCDAPIRILKYDLTAWEIGLVQQPPMSTDDYCSIALTTAEGGGLGAATVEEGSKLYLWSWEPAPLNSGDNMGWTQRRVIDFKMLIPNCPFVHTPDVVGFAEGAGVVCMGMDRQFFTYDFKSGRLTQVQGVRGHGYIVPFVGFYTPPALEVASTSEGPGNGASNA